MEYRITWDELVPLVKSVNTVSANAIIVMADWRQLEQSLVQVVPLSPLRIIHIRYRYATVRNTSPLLTYSRL